MSDHDDENLSESESYQGAGQSSGVSTEDGQRPDHLQKADGGQSSRAARDRTVVDSRPLGQSSHQSRNRQPSQRDQSVAARKRSRSGQRSQTDADIVMELRRLTSSIQRIEDRVHRLESAGSRGSSPAPKRRAPESRTSTPQIWADRDLNEGVGRSAMEWSDDEDDGDHDPPVPATLSEDNLALLASSFTTTLSNATRRKVRDTFPLPELKETRCPRLDPIFKSSSVGAEVRAADSELARLQAFVLDPVGPLIRVLRATEDDPDNPGITMEEAKVAVADAVKLLGNASAQISRLRRRKILKAVNPEIQDLAEEDIFGAAAPDLFGAGFEAKMKERADSMKLLQAARPPSTAKKFFQGGRPARPQRGGGQNRRGRQPWTKRQQAPSKK